MATAASFYSFFLILSWCADVSEREGGIQKRGEFLAVLLCVNVIYKANETNLCIQCMHIVKRAAAVFLIREVSLYKQMKVCASRFY